MNDPEITAEIIRRITGRQPGLQIKDTEAWLWDKADKVDPFNVWAVLAVKARIGGKSGAWVVQTRNDKGGDLVSRLLDGAVEEMIAKPDQDEASAAVNRRTVG